MQTTKNYKEGLGEFMRIRASFIQANFGCFMALAVHLQRRKAQRLLAKFVNYKL